METTMTRVSHVMAEVPTEVTLLLRSHAHSYDLETEPGKPTRPNWNPVTWPDSCHQLCKVWHFWPRWGWLTKMSTVKNFGIITRSPQAMEMTTTPTARRTGAMRTGLSNMPFCSTIRFSVLLINRRRRYPHVPKQIRVPNMTFPGNTAAKSFPIPCLLLIYRRIVIASQARTFQGFTKGFCPRR